MIALGLGGHIGARVTDLVDGRLDPATEERAWGHVLRCQGCRALVEAEGWTKRTLSTLPVAPGAPYLSPDLMGSLQRIDDIASWNEEHPASDSRVARRATWAAAGVGSIGAAVLGLAALNPAPMVVRDVPAQPASIRSGVPTPTPSATPPADTSDRGLRRTTR